MMSYRTGVLVALLACSSFALFGSGTVSSADVAGKNAVEHRQSARDVISGKVTDTIDTAGYTYAEVDTGKEKVWAAATTTPLKIGDEIAFTTEMPMRNFHSNSLKRDFPVIYFVNGFITDTESLTGAGPAASNAKGSPAPAVRAIEGIDKVEGGNTIAEVYVDKQKLAGKAVRVRGQVTKFTPDIMNKNWVHIRDSSTPNDLTVTTEDTAAIDAVVVIEGRLALDKDFGHGYVYPLIVEDARLTQD